MGKKSYVFALESPQAFGFYWLSGNSSSWIAHLSACLASRGIECLSSGLYFKDVFIVNIIGRQT
jgi:MFS-type transporter involved in bile tolerance (Atg22 family)